MSIADKEGQDQGRIVQALQSPASVITYRAIVGFFVVIITGMLGFFGQALVNGQQRLSDLMDRVQISQATNKGRIDEQTRRLDVDDTAIATLNQEAGSLDHRVTVIEIQRAVRPNQ